MTLDAPRTGNRLATIASVLTVWLATACAAQEPTTVSPPPPPPPSCSLPTGALPPASVTVAIDPTVHFQTLEGFGATERLFDDPHLTNTFDAATQRSAVVIPADQQSAILKALYTDLGLTRERYATDVNVEPVNDNSDPLITDLSAFNFAWKGGDGHVALAAQSAPFGLTTVWGSPIGTEKWMSHTDPAEFAEWSFAVIQEWNRLGHPLAYWSIKNEPAISSPPIRGVFLRDAIKILGPKLAAAGIPTKLVAPDETDPSDALASATIILADPVARQYVAAIPFHLYDRTFPPAQPNTAGLVELKALAAQYRIPLWMSEWYNPDWFTWAKAVHSMLADYDVTAVDYVFGFFGQWETVGSQLVTINYIGNLYTGFVKAKQYWITGQWSRFIPPGSTRVKTTSSDPAVETTAWRVGDRVVVVAVNTLGDKTVQFALGAGTPCVQAVTSERTSNVETARILDPFDLAGPGFTTTLSGTSVTTFVIK